MDGRRVAGRVAGGLVALVVLVVAIHVVRATAPSVEVPAVGVGAPDADDLDLVTCERTLPDAPELREDVAEVEAVGRVRSSEVIECPVAFDGQVVEYVGEVIGDVLRRTGGAWLLVNDDDYALEDGPLSAGHGRFSGYNTGLSVWLPGPPPDLEPGRSGRRGTIIRVRGVVRRSDPADGGGLTLRALAPGSTSIVAPAEAIERPVNRGQAVLAGVLAVAATGVVVAERRSRRQRR